MVGQWVDESRSQDCQVISSVLVHVLLYSLIQGSSYLFLSASPLTLTHLLQKTGKSLVTFLQQLWQHLYWNTQALYLAVVQSVAEPGNSISIWGTNPDILGRNKVKGVGRREAETNTSPEHNHPLPLTWFHQQETYLPEWTSGAGVDFRDLGRLPITQAPTQLWTLH